MKRVLAFSIVASLLASQVFMESCERSDEKDLPGDPVPILLNEKQMAVVDSANGFAFNIFSPIVQAAKGTENVIISPFSISSALSMAINGAETETYDEMLKALCLEGMTLQEINDAYLKLMTDMVPVDERVVLKIANSVWAEINFTVKAGFIQALEEFYKADSKSFDVSAPEASLEEINSWIEENTNGMIKDMLDHMDPSTVMYLINAVYFNGKWKYQFDAGDTGDKPFFLTSGSSVNVSMMYNETNLAYSHKDNVTLLEVPYGQGNYTMVIALPDEGVTPADVASTLDAAKWYDWMAGFENAITEVHLSMPRFRYGYKRTLNDDLRALGMITAFTDLADFSGITDRDIYISEVIHQAFIETNEEGTEAAAATVVVFDETSTEPSYATVELNRPFLYFIREVYTGTIVFMGVVEDPSAE